MYNLDDNTLVVGNVYTVECIGNEHSTEGTLTYLGTVMINGYYDSIKNATQGFKFLNTEGREIILTNNASYINGSGDTIFLTVYSGYCDGIKYKFV